MVNTAAKKHRKRQFSVPVQRVFFWLTSGFIALALVMMGLGIKELQKPDSLPIRVVQIKGDFKHLQVVDVEKRVADVVQGGFFTIDMHSVRDAVRNVPWVEEASVRRSWPDKLIMTVTEHVPLARWNKDAYVNVSGSVFTPEPGEKLMGLVMLSGPDGSSKRVVDFYQHVQKVSGAIELKVVALSLDARRDWSVRYDNGLELALGKESVIHRLNEFMRIYPRLTAMPNKFPLRIDMRYEHGFAVKWREQEGAIAADGVSVVSVKLGGEA